MTRNEKVYKIKFLKNYFFKKTTASCKNKTEKSKH